MLTRYLMPLLLIFAALPAFAADDTLTPIRPQDLPRGFVLQDSSRELWHINDAGLLHWNPDKRTWDKTPIVTLPHPPWRAHPAPPWNAWSVTPHVIPGADGTLLVIAVHDVYQDAFKKNPQVHDTWDLFPYQRFPGTADGSDHWLEAAIYSAGKWSESAPLHKLLAANRALLVKSFTRPTETLAAADVLSFSGNLWYTDTAGVHTLDERGSRADLPIAGDVKKRSDPVSAAKFILRGKDLLLCINGKEIVALKLEQGVITSTNLPDAAIPASVYPGTFAIHSAAHGSVWLSQYGGHVRSPGVGNGLAWLLKEGKWQQSNELGKIVYESKDSELWFLPGTVPAGDWPDLEHDSDHAIFIILAHDRRVPLVIPSRVLAGKALHGQISAISDSALIITGRDRAFLLVRPDKAPWEVSDTVTFKTEIEPGPIYLDRCGTLVGPTGWYVQVPAGKRQTWLAPAKP